ncbi:MULTISPECIES: bifunctional hydroxymethylpyrimidine kinase/phosphomethylpyrimidine kinase [unclassified Nocardioides]|uniref:bifunctional hydroxymethylpyrimidine kinase/phosphomethylpyrimidine kinase n=1 Tax=unclassified Nocardioides TaxID=2615069 RepID=UPI00360C24ED
MTPPVVLTIAGSDSGGAAGIAADLTTFAALGAHGAVAVTAITAQCTLGVHRIVPLPPDDVVAQVRAVLDDLPVAAVKTGMLGSADVARAVVAVLPADVPLVVDPVLVATSGAVLAAPDLVAAYREVVLPRATVATPNTDERAALGELPCPSLVTGASVDVLDGQPLRAARVPTDNDHGTGCTHSAALAAYLAHGRPLAEAARLAQQFVVDRLTVSASWSLGRGRGPVAHIL